MLSNFQIYKNYIKNSLDLIDEIVLEDIISYLWITYKHKDQIFIIGNGGSAANASHFAQDLVKGTYPDYHGLKDDKSNNTFNAISLTDNTSFITAISNDDGYKHVFTNQLKSFHLTDNPCLIVISGSGNSKNVINAIKWANRNNVTTISFTGFDGGDAKKLSKFNLNVKLDDMLAVETIHSFIFHYIVESLKFRRTQDE